MKKVLFLAVFVALGYTFFKFVKNNFNVKKTIESLKDVWQKAPDIYDVNSIAWDSEYKEPSYFTRSQSDIYALNAKTDRDSFVRNAEDVFYSVNAQGNPKYYEWLSTQKDDKSVASFKNYNENWTYSNLGKTLGLIP